MGLFPYCLIMSWYAQISMVYFLAEIAKKTSMGRDFAGGATSPTGGDFIGPCGANLGRVKHRAANVGRGQGFRQNRTAFPDLSQ